MLVYFGDPSTTVYSVSTDRPLTAEAIEKLTWLFGGQGPLPDGPVDGPFFGPRPSMVTPWGTNATEIVRNTGIEGVDRVEAFHPHQGASGGFDPMIHHVYERLDARTFEHGIVPEPIHKVSDIAAYNEKEGLALSAEEIDYLIGLSNRLGRPLTDSEVFGFSQVNSEHCRHKIFNGRFVIDGEEKGESLFALIKRTAKENPNDIVSAYRDNVAFVEGPELVQFAPLRPERPDTYVETPFRSVLSLKAETHNFPTTVEPFNGAATGSGGEIRDRLAGGRGSLPLAGTAVYMTAYSRPGDTEGTNRPWEDMLPARPWLYQTPLDILIKASDGASDFGNKYGQPLIAGSVLTFEHDESRDTVDPEGARPRQLGFDKVVMLAGGIGYGKRDQSAKDRPGPGDRIVILGGDNYRIGMGGAAVSSANTGDFGSGIELNAVQRSNPEMQKRVANTVRAMVERPDNPIVSIHDHGAGGHLNCLSELVEETGGHIDLERLPVGDPTLSMKELIGNESQERMGLVIKESDRALLKSVADRERSPMHDVGHVTGDHRFTFAPSEGEAPMDLELSDLFGNAPRTVMEDRTVTRAYAPLAYSLGSFHDYLDQVLALEAVGCKDWLTNKVDRCVGGRVAVQQCIGPLQLPLNNVGVMALDFKGTDGLATSIGHAPVAGLIDSAAGARLSIAEALTNIVWAPLEKGLRSVSLSANWMWPCRNEGEDARIYRAVQAVSDFAVALGINVPTGKDSLSMKQRYPDGEVLAPGTVIISAAGHCKDFTRTVEPLFRPDGGALYYLDFCGGGFPLGGSSFAQVLGAIGEEAPDVRNADAFAIAFDALQEAIAEGAVLAGHDIGSGGLVTTLLEGCFADNGIGADLDLGPLGEPDLIKLLFSEKPGVVVQAVDGRLAQHLGNRGVAFHEIGRVNTEGELIVRNHGVELGIPVASARERWYRTSYLFDREQTAGEGALERFRNFAEQPLRYVFPERSTRIPRTHDTTERPVAAVLREKGSNSEREMANALFLAGFEVRDVHMTDLVEGREDLSDVHFLGAVGGFSNSDVLGSAKGWAGVFRYNDRARKALEGFFARPDTLSVGICNGCQLFMELDLLYPDMAPHPKMAPNLSGKHESAFTSVVIGPNPSVMLGSLEGCSLGVWISHGEGRFVLPGAADRYDIVARYGYDAYPANPNGSDHAAAMLCDPSGRHLVTMPHIERSIFPWNWAHYPESRKDEVSPWLEAFSNAHSWILKHRS